MEKAIKGNIGSSDQRLSDISGHGCDDEHNDSSSESSHEQEEVQHLCHAEQLNISSLCSREDDDCNDDDHQWTLRLPATTATTASGRNPEVPATCIICLKRYRPKEQVTWSPNNHNQSSHTNGSRSSGSCCHVFHQHCIVEWLAKLPDFNCPICRNTFCHVPPTSTSHKRKSQKRVSS